MLAPGNIDQQNREYTDKFMHISMKMEAIAHNKENSVSLMSSSGKNGQLYEEE